MGRLEGKIALVTGGSRGIGLATAQRLVREGAQVFIAGRDPATLERAIGQLGPSATALCADVGRLPDLDRLFAAVQRTAGRLDVLFANAGMSALTPIGSVTEQCFDRIFDTNVKGTMFTVQKALPLMSSGGSIILAGSSAATTGTAAFSAYGASKAAVRALARNWILELKPRRIRVNVISPGPTRTEMLTALAPPAQVDRMIASFATRIPSGRIASPDDIANAVVFLASDESSFINGIDLAVDGGMAQV